MRRTIICLGTFNYLLLRAQLPDSPSDERLAVQPRRKRFPIATSSTVNLVQHHTLEVASFMLLITFKARLTSIQMDTLTPRARSERMSRIRNKDTKPEMVVRRLAHKLGYRFRLHVAALPGKPDLVFARRRKAVFVHGCFWHQHKCAMGRVPKSRLDFWLPKLHANKVRDQKCRRQLTRMGWQTLTVWECQLKDLSEVGKELIKFLGAERCDP